MLYFSQLEWAELAPHKVTGKIFGWFRIPGPQRLICDGRPCPHLGSEVRRHHCPPDTGQLCAGHKAGKPLRPSRPSCPTHFQNLSCQKQPRPLALQEGILGGMPGRPSKKLLWPGQLQPPRRCLQCVRVPVWPQQVPLKESTHRLPSCQTQVLSGLPALPPAIPPTWNTAPILSIGPIATPSQPCTRSSSVQALHNSAPTGTTPSHELTAFTACALH